jgi:hypothetical protein
MAQFRLSNVVAQSAAAGESSGCSTQQQRDKAALQSVRLHATGDSGVGGSLFDVRDGQSSDVGLASERGCWEADFDAAVETFQKVL